MTFEYRRVKDISEALGLLKVYGEDSRIFAGGTDLLVNIRHQAIDPTILIDLKPIASLSYIRYDEENTLRIGSLTPLRTIERSSEIMKSHPLIAECARSVATLQIRNVGTIGGNLCQTVKCCYFNQSHINLFMRRSIEPCRQRGGSVCHASRVDTLNHAILGDASNGCIAPTASDLATPLVALGARIKTIGPRGERMIPVEDFVTGGGRTALQGEIVTEVQVQRFEESARSAYRKYSRGMRNFSILNLAVIVRYSSDLKVIRNIDAVMGGIGPVPLRLSFGKARSDKGMTAAHAAETIMSNLGGARIRGPLTEYKLERAKAMISDTIGSLLGSVASGRME